MDRPLGELRMHPQDAAEYRRDLLRLGVGLTGLYHSVRGSEWHFERGTPLHFNGYAIAEDASVPRGEVQFQ